MENVRTILIVSSVFIPEPVVSARISQDIAMELSELGNNVTVFSPYPSRPIGIDYSKVSLNSLHYKRIIADSFVYPKSDFYGRMKESFSFGLKTYQYIRKNKNNISVIYANTKPIFGVYFTVLAAMKFSIPIILHIQDIYPESMLSRLQCGYSLLSKIFICLDKYILGKVNKIIVISEKMREYLCTTRNIPMDKFEVVRNWQDYINRDTFPKYHKHKPFTFMFVGSLSPASNIVFLIESFIRSNIRGAQLVVAGDGTLKDKCVKLVKDSGVSNIVFRSVTPEDVPFVQNGADVLVLSLKKGIGNTASPSKLSAYMLSGKPILASVDKDCDTDCIIRNVQCGKVVESDDSQDLINGMMELMELSTQTLEIMGTRGYKYASKYMSKDYNLSKIVNLIILKKK